MFRFLRAFFASPRTIGAVAPSSKSLAAAMLEATLSPNDRVIVEYGPGTGAFTEAILDRKAPEALVLAVEQHPDFVRELAARFPLVHLHCESVENLPTILAGHGVEAVDCIISGLPWAVFSDPLQDRILDVTCAALAPGGRFATFAYVHGLVLPAAQRFAAKLDERFSQVTRSPVVWRNVPPAFVYRCQR
jgi:phospholipid N-methyltransferase